MIPAHLTSAWVNHLWQSTLFACAAGLLALVLRKNQARTRYWLWLLASVKFLVPFSWLAAVGSHFGRPGATAAAAPFGFSFVEQISQPFTAPAVAGPVAPVVMRSAANPLPVILVSLWICGFLAIVFFWWVRWRRIRATVHAGSRLAVKNGVPIVSSPALVEPGVFGIFRPVLLLPEGITDRLASAQLESILAHEFCHIRRRDNLAAAIHMLTEAIFWFHPLIWWIGARLVEERECACDEEVLQLGNDPEVYAESILQTCQFYLESPLACASGVTGGDLKQRIVRIMTQRAIHRLALGKKLLLAFAATAAIIAPVIFGVMAGTGQAQSTPPSAAAESAPSFEVASIKPNHSGAHNVSIMNSPGGRFVATNIPLKTLIQFAYKVQDFQITGGPGWMNSDRFDIEAKPESAAAIDMQKLTDDQRDAFQELQRLRLQALLADRFLLKLHRGTKELPVYALVVAKNGPKLHESVPESAAEPSNRPGPKGPAFRGRGMRMTRGQLTAQAATLQFLADALSNQLGRTVIDKTGLKGAYDFTLQWTPDESQGRMFRGPGPGGPESAEGAPPPESGPSIFTALQEQLGLKIESEKGPVEMLVIEHVEQPSPN